MRNVVLGFLGTRLDAGRRPGWWPSVQLCAYGHFRWTGWSCCTTSGICPLRGTS